jgi:hypothetical protein
MLGRWHSRFLFDHHNRWKDLTMKTVNLLRLTLLVGLGASLGACNLTSAETAAQAAVNPAAIAVGSVTGPNLTALGIDPVKAEAFATKVQATATKACAFEPSVEGIAALVAAAYPPAASVISITKIAGLACTAYKNRIAVNSTATYSALDEKKKPETVKPPAKPEPKPGEEVEGVVNVNGKMIVVPGVKK